jgi:hypothetical protein
MQVLSTTSIGLRLMTLDTFWTPPPSLYSLTVGGFHNGGFPLWAPLMWHLCIISGPPPLLISLTIYPPSGILPNHYPISPLSDSTPVFHSCSLSPLCIYSPSHLSTLVSLSSYMSPPLMLSFTRQHVTSPHLFLLSPHTTHQLPPTPIAYTPASTHPISLFDTCPHVILYVTTFLLPKLFLTNHLAR